MNALELYEACFDSACDHIPDDRNEMIEYVIDYAENAWDKPIYVSKNNAEKIVDCRLNHSINHNGMSQNYYNMVVEQLEDIELKNPAAVALGRLGGLSKSPVKSQSSASNGKLGGRPKKKVAGVVSVSPVVLRE